MPTTMPTASDHGARSGETYQISGTAMARPTAESAARTQKSPRERFRAISRLATGWPAANMIAIMSHPTIAVLDRLG